MNVGEIKAFVMFQTNNDAEDVGEYMPYLLDYINEGYDKMLYASANRHAAPDTDCPPLLQEEDAPNLPAWTHLGIANWATWCVYRNGNPAKQSRGVQFRAAAEEIASQLRSGTETKNFYNMPR